ncbi:MAG TPA: ABC transporter permease [Candidatus Polarisedimenticolia bacterium]|jgi:predicted permease|nr:ABC transporter permease [Candidatus Polarisedimenticolia bacterium]
MDTFLQDLKFALRSLRARPVIAVVAILALALGIGANSAIFSLVHAVLLRPLPFRDADRLVLIWHDYGKGMNLSKATLSVPTYIEYRDHVEAFESVAVGTPWNANLTGAGDPERLQGSLVSGNFFRTLGVAPTLGRDFLPEEDKPGGNRVVLLSDGLYRRRFGADPAIVGKTISLNGENHTVVGVVPKGFQFMMPVDLYKPVAFTPEQAAPENHGNEFLVGVARIKPGLTMAQAAAQLAALGEKLQKQFYPEGWHPVMFPLHGEIVGDLRPALLMLNAAVACVLLIACANIANLLLARATGRAREIAVRAALGAGRLRLARLLLTESLFLGILGGAAGLVVAWWGIRVLQAAAPPALLQNVLGGRPATINPAVLMFTSGVSVLTGVLFGLLPAMRASRVDLHDTLKEGARGESVGAHGHRLLGGFVVSQVAVAFVLLVGAGLLLRSFARLREVDPGFRPERLMTMRVALPPNRYADKPAIGAFYERLGESLRALPGVTAAALVSNLPMSGNNSSGSFEIEGSPTPDGQPSPHGDSHYVSRGYFETMAIPLVQGRFFDGRDSKEGTPSILIDDVLARRYWPDGSALGHRLAKYGEGPDKQPVWRQIVGVVGHVKKYGLDGRVKEQYYVPAEQVPQAAMSLVIRSASDPAEVVSAARAAVRALDPEVPVFSVKTMAEWLDDTLVMRRFVMSLLAGFAATALLLAAVGLYGVLAYSVAQRTHEIGVRMALGARSGDVVMMVVRRGMLLAAGGLAAGGVLAVGLTRFIQSQLFGVGAADPFTYLLFALALAGVALFACFIPARRAARVAPTVALRYE